MNCLLCRLVYRLADLCHILHLGRCYMRLTMWSMNMDEKFDCREWVWPEEDRR